MSNGTFWRKIDLPPGVPHLWEAQVMTAIGTTPANPHETLVQSEPVALHQARAEEAWVDFNGHMNVAYYAIIFDRALDNFFELVGLGHEYARAAGGSMFVVESHFTYQREVMAGDPLEVRFQLLDHDRKRIHCIMELYQVREGFLAATSEQIAIHVDMTARKSTSMPVETAGHLAQILDAHRRIARPKEVGHKIGIRRKPPLSVPVV